MKIVCGQANAKLSATKDCLSDSNNLHEAEDFFMNTRCENEKNCAVSAE